MSEDLRKCVGCFEYMALSCGEHGDCNETGLIVPKDGSCPSWHKIYIQQVPMEELEPFMESQFWPLYGIPKPGRRFDS